MHDYSHIYSASAGMNMHVYAVALFGAVHGIHSSHLLPWG